MHNLLKLLMSTSPTLGWFLVGVIMLTMEILSPGLILFFFGVGALLVSLICFVADISFNTQLAIFVSSSTFFLLILRKWLKDIFMGYTTKTGQSTESEADFVSKTAIVIRKIEQYHKGKVEFRGTHWDAESDEAIQEGEPVEITGKDNITLKVKTLKGR